MAAGEQARAQADGVVHKALHVFDAARVGQRPHLRGGIHARPQAQGLRCRAEALRESAQVRTRHVKADRRSTHLPGIAVLGRYRLPEHEVHRPALAHVLAHDDRRMPAQLAREALHMRRRLDSQQLAHGHRAGDGHLGDLRSPDEEGRDLRRVAAHEVDRIGRHARIQKALHQQHATARGFLRRLDDHAAACGERAAQLATGQVDGKIPGSEGRHWAHGHPRDGVRKNACHPGRHGPAIQALGLFRLKVDDVCRQRDLAPGLAQRLALLQGKHGRHGIDPLAQQVRCAAQDHIALVRAHAAPGQIAALCRFGSGCQFGQASQRQQPELHGGSRVDDGARTTAGVVSPLAGHM
ncbi:hypothetical protein D3C71_1248010 [compost metagenome]